MEQGAQSRKSRKRSPVVRLLSALLALYAVAGMGASAAALAKTTRQLQELQESLQETASEIDAARQALAECGQPEYIRRQAFRTLSMVSPEDIVFFDGG